ncbi:MAG: glycosyltransferase [Saprospiraceae bacterium]|jgi:cellulose synthase/poly-beta-1,6-N-acetylglucosamine synthase-like glycosyltransferase|nr:glycosyltransferase [Saprospiraceae bacterium]
MKPELNKIYTDAASLPMKQALKPFAETHRTAARQMAGSPKPTLYIAVFSIWILALVWFQPRLLMLLDMAYNWPSSLALWLFIGFIDFAWLYGVYNVAIVGFAVFYQLRRKYAPAPVATIPHDSGIFPPVAILYTTCNDFVEESVLSCVRQDYPDFKVYLLDDSSDAHFKSLVDNFAARYPERTVVVRRPDRKAFKAGNMNHALEYLATQEPYFAIADADEILPPDFLSKLVPVMENDPTCGFVQANHRANPHSASPLAKSLGVGIDIHWKWYQPLRNDYGFVMFLGHGALLRRKCWEEIGGFPDIVSEDLGFAIHVREKGYRGRFVEEVVCYEDFPDTVRAFRIRHMKWTRGTSEFLRRKMGWLLRAKNISWTEKLDVLFPTLNLPLTLLYFLFMLNANLALPLFFSYAQDLTFVVGSHEFLIPILVLNPGFEVIYDWDFFAITLLTFFAPVLSFVLALAHRPLKLFRFLSHSTALYAALSPLSSIGVLAYMISGKAFFLVTGDTNQKEYRAENTGKKWPGLNGFRNSWQQFLAKSHPDTKLVQGFEIGAGLLFMCLAMLMFQISFFGLCLAFLLLPLMHHLPWNHRFVKVAVYVPFVLIMFGVLLSGLSVFGMKAVFFGYGFHF